MGNFEAPCFLVCIIYIIHFTVLDNLFLLGMKISDISVNISPIYPISVMFDTISTMTDISPIYWDIARATDLIYRDISRIYRDISEIYLNDQI